MSYDGWLQSDADWDRFHGLDDDDGDRREREAERRVDEALDEKNATGATVATMALPWKSTTPKEYRTTGGVRKEYGHE